MSITAGYGYYRPQMQLFDPGWRGEQAKGPEDWGVADFGNDPMGVVDRFVLQVAVALFMLYILLVYECWSHVVVVATATTLVVVTTVSNSSMGVMLYMHCFACKWLLPESTLTCIFRSCCMNLWEHVQRFVPLLA